MDRDPSIKSEATKAFPCTIYPIPGPRPLPLLGNILDIDLVSPLDSLIKLVGKYGPIFSLTFAGKREITVSSRELVEELSDESRFCKLVTSGVETMRAAAGDGLFTAQHNNHTWGVAHRILMPVFGPLKIRSMFDEMNDLSEQLCLKWARLGPFVPIEVADDFTRLTLDTIALCSMDYRFNSFYLDKKTHPFVESMIAVLGEADLQAVLPDFVSLFRPRAMSRFRKHIEQMQSTCREIIAQRRASPIKDQSNDLLNAMLNGRDPETGDSLSEEAIVHNIITFLVAGHETTSGLLSFAIYYLVEHPEELRKAREEVDRVIGEGPINVQHLQQLPFLDCVFRETLRLMPTAPGYYVTPFKDEIVGGQYLVRPGEALCVLLHTLHRDPDVWGPDAEEFKPDRMRNLDDIPNHAWKPFGNGMRGCIGRVFAWQEAQLVIAMLLRNFDMKKDDPDYELKVKHLLTIKPAGFKVRVRLRDDKRPTDFLKSLRSRSTESTIASQQVHRNQGAAEGRQMLILYGSDTGTCEALSQRLAAEASSKGFSPTMMSMNDAVGKLPKDVPVLIITASYNGLPSRDASKFVSWAQTLHPGDLEGVQYAVFGCGHRDWPATLFKVPMALDTMMDAAGAKRLTHLGTADTATTDVFSALEDWLENHFWPKMLDGPQEFDVNHGTDVDIEVTYEPPSHATTRSGFVTAVVQGTCVLSSKGALPKRHLDLKLPDHVSYEAGDHLQVLPMNDPQLVQKALSRFNLSGDTRLTITSSTGRSLHVPANTPVTAWDLFSSVLELSHAATPKDIRILADVATIEDTRATLRTLSTQSAAPGTRDKRVTALDLMLTFPDIKLDLSVFLLMLPQMRPRTYSLSSTPGWQKRHATLTYTVEDKGVASNYLASLLEGDVLQVSPLPSTANFSLPSPAVQANTPIIMIAAGTGLAPFRGFIQERALLHRSGQDLAPALLFFGCRASDLDDLYRNELDEFECEGVVMVHRAFSRQATSSYKYVMDQLRDHIEEISDLSNDGAKVYVCGAKRVADSVLEILEPILAAGNLEGKQIPDGRYVVEIFN
ncbi:cytochrome P450 [Colletotrichum karsti]|uniref:Bifunctional cytochrome P450/NADPH--P450 reductase n=1 Tax=Colletotrichum karsti TaxID=1095194 RepID=A0A9P6I4F2_9PEZI|nr:cytochrome P450 [Colletotrichum karsti]KAF9877148.1 cytochrome P450 [Colletotrichum karsti]